MKHLASEDKPTQEGYYMWWDDSGYIHPHQSLVYVFRADGIFHADFYFGEGGDPLPMDEVADRLWLKVKY